MKGRIVCCLSSALVIGLSACGGDGGGTQPPQPGGISGSVTAGTTAVGGAAIALSGSATQNTTTNATGQFSFGNLNPGAYTLTLTLPSGFQLGNSETLAKNATVTAGQTATVNWSLVAGEDGVTEVRLQAASFEPAEVRIKVGEKVRWIGVVGSHTVTPDNPSQDGVWEGFNLSAGQNREVTFNTAGTFPYHCIPHSPGMVGTVIVEAS